MSIHAGGATGKPVSNLEPTPSAGAARTLWPVRTRATLHHEGPGPLSETQLAPVDDSAAAAALLWDLLREYDCDAAAALYLDPLRRPLGLMVACVGTRQVSFVEPRRFLTAALLLKAATFIAAHFSRSGEIALRAGDEVFARRLSLAAGRMGVPLLDFLLVAEPGRWTSLGEKLMREAS
jgi:DNA repair protein RadC